MGLRRQLTGHPRIQSSFIARCSYVHNSGSRRLQSRICNNGESFEYRSDPTQLRGPRPLPSTRKVITGLSRETRGLQWPFPSTKVAQTQDKDSEMFIVESRESDMYMPVFPLGI